jgi:hypothetical protein
MMGQIMEMFDPRMEQHHALIVLFVLPFVPQRQFGLGRELINTPVAWLSRVRLEPEN